MNGWLFDWLISVDFMNGWLLLLVGFTNIVPLLKSCTVLCSYHCDPRYMAFYVPALKEMTRTSCKGLSKWKYLCLFTWYKILAAYLGFKLKFLSNNRLTAIKVASPHNLGVLVNPVCLNTVEIISPARNIFWSYASLGHLFVQVFLVHCRTSHVQCIAINIFLVVSGSLANWRIYISWWNTGRSFVLKNALPVFAS